MSSCANPASGDGEELMQGKRKFDRSANCIKCKTERGNIVIRHVVYCKSCFTPLVTTKVKKCLDPYINDSPSTSRRTALKASGNLVLGHSGGIGSAVVLDVLNKCYFPSEDDLKLVAKAHPRKKRVWEKAYICHVDISSAFPEGQLDSRTKNIRDSVKSYEHFEFVSAKLEDAFDPDWWAKISNDNVPENGIIMSDEELPLLPLPSTSQLDPRSALRSYLTSLPTSTALESTISTLTRIILKHTARSLGCSHLALGTSLTSLSISLINSISQGGGYIVSEESFEEWSPSDGTDEASGSVRIVRPLRDVSLKECAAWAWWHGLEIPGRPKYLRLNSKQTIGRLTRDFIVGLDRDFPSTVSTIARTCAKVTSKDEADFTCAICERPTHKGVLNWKSRISIRSLSPEGEDEKGSSPSLSPHLCYACHTTLTSRTPRGNAFSTQIGDPDRVVPLPVWSTPHLRANQKVLLLSANSERWKTKPLDDENMRRKIADFLLEE